MWVLGVDGAAVVIGLGALSLVLLRLYRQGRDVLRAVGEVTSGAADGGSGT